MRSWRGHCPDIHRTGRVVPMSAVYGYGGWGGRLLSGPKRIFKRSLTMTRKSWSITKVKSPEKLKYKLVGGPFDGHKVYLVDGTTMVFSVTVTKLRQGVCSPQVTKYRGCYRAAMVATLSDAGTARWWDAP